MKPHYVFKGGQWWVFASMNRYKKYISAIITGRYNSKNAPRPMIKTKCGGCEP